MEASREKGIQESLQLIQVSKRELGKRIIGQEAVLEALLRGIVAGGHILLEGVPGLAKTLAVRTLAEIMGLDFKRL